MKSIELFAGAGGLGMGIQFAGFDTQRVVEWDKWCCQTLRSNTAVSPVDCAIVEDDIRRVQFKEFEGRIDLVSGGPPCQPFSLGGKHRGQNDLRDMFPEAVRVVRQVKPRAFIFENVRGLTRSTFASYFEYIKLQMTFPAIVRQPKEEWHEHLSRLENHMTKGHYRGLQYNVVARVLNAADYGVPQRRERVFFVGFRSDLGVEWHFPEGEYSKAALVWSQATGEYWERLEVPKSQRVPSGNAKPITASIGTKPWRTVREALQGLPDPEKHPRLAKKYLNHKFQPGARSYPGHTGSPLDEPSKTLKAGVHGVPGGENMLRRPDGSIRYFSVRESARLQTFPDDFDLHGAWGEAMRQLGNAVPVNLAQILAKDVHDHLMRHSG